MTSYVAESWASIWEGNAGFPREATIELNSKGWRVYCDERRNRISVTEISSEMVLSQKKTWSAQRKQKYMEQMTGRIHFDFGSMTAAGKCFLSFLSISLEWLWPVSHLAAREAFSKCKPSHATNSTMVPHCPPSKGHIPSMGYIGIFGSFACASHPSSPKGQWLCLWPFKALMLVHLLMSVPTAISFA